MSTEKNTPENRQELSLQCEDTEPSPLSLIARMIHAGQLTAESVSVVERLVELKEHMEDKKAERDFARDFAALQAELPEIKAVVSVPNNDGTVRYRYAPYEDIKAQVKPFMKKYGFADSYSSQFCDGRIIQTCTLLHCGGHKKSNTIFVRIGSGPPKSSETQADGAANTYAIRIAFCAALGIAIDRDTDARSEGTLISAEQAQYLREQIAETKSDEAAFLRMAGAATYEEIGSAKYDVLVRAIEMKKGRR